MGVTTTRRGGGKRGELTDGALSDEVLDSSPSVLYAGRGGAMRGLQQFYSPPEAAELIAAVNGRDLATLDPTAGDGALLAPVAEEARFGIEIDPDQVAAGGYRAIGGDLQRAYPLLRVLGARVARIAANPPFGLTWSTGAGTRESSTVATWRMCQGLLAPRGCGAFIAGRDRFLRDVAPRADAAGVYALVECPDLFDGVALPCLIAFFLAPENRVENMPAVELHAKRGDLRALACEGVRRSR